MYDNFPEIRFRMYIKSSLILNQFMNIFNVEIDQRNYN